MQRTYTVAREGFLMNRYKKVGDKVQLHPRQATYLIHAGQLTDPDAVKTKSVTEKAAEIFAAAAAAAPPVEPESEAAPTEPVEPEADITK